MVSKSLSFPIVLILLCVSSISCQWSRKPRNIDEGHAKIIDTIVFRTSSERFIYLANRIYPPKISYGENAIAELTQSEITCVEEVGDTLFVFLNNNFLHYESNPNFPAVNDSLFEYFYPRHFEVKIDDDIPYFVYLRSDKDFVELVKNKSSGSFGWETAIIRDTVLSFFSGVKIGMSKDDLFVKLNMPKLEFNKMEFSMILCHASIPSKVWYKQVLNSKGYELESDKPNTQILLKFKGGNLNSIYLHPMIGYGKKAPNPL